MTTNPEHTVVQVIVPGVTSSLALVRKVVTHLAADAGFAEEEIDKIEIAVDEACTNAMEHAYRDFSPKPSVQVEITATDTELVIDILDVGASFEYAAYVPPKFPDHWNEGNTRGVGLYLIHQCMDQLTYEQLPNETNRLRLIKKLSNGT